MIKRGVKIWSVQYWKTTTKWTGKNKSIIFYIAKLETLKGKSDNINTNLTEGARIRAGIKWFEEGEKSSKFFHSLEKKGREKDYGELLGKIKET